MTKVFTASLLSQMVQRGDVSLTDPASKYLPAGVTLPERGGKATADLIVRAVLDWLQQFPPAEPQGAA